MKVLSWIASLFFMLFYLGSCITEIEPEDIGFDDLLVVEALITDKAVKHVVKLSRTVPINASGVRPESNAVVRVESTDQGTIAFFEEEPGIYRSSLPIAGKFDTQYKLLITTADGNEYESSEVEMVATPAIDAITAEFVPEPLDTIGPALKYLGDFNFYLDSKNNQNKTKSLRYLWTETYKIRVPNPSRWKWLGGNSFEFRNEDIPEEQEEFCYRYDSSRTIIVNKSLTSSGEVLRYPIHSFDARTRQMNIRYSLEVVQYGLSVESEKYWTGLATGAQSQGSLFDIQPGTITGNIKPLSDPNETVLGIFEVAQEGRKRVFFRASDFYSQGFGPSSLTWIDCEDIEQEEVALASIGEFMSANNEKYELLYFTTSFAPSGGPAIFGIKRCALCTLYGTNKKPAFWID